MPISNRRQACLEEVAEWVISCDNKEFEDYITYCDDNYLDPKQVDGKEQSKHVYAKALIGLGLAFPKE